MTAPALTRRTILGGSLATAGLTLASPAIAGAATSSGWPSISGAANSNDVRAVQYLLLAAGSQFRTSWGNTYDPNTRAMVMAFQRSRRLPVTGRADPTTLVALTGTLSRGTTSYRTYAAQTLLNKHGYGQALATTYNTQTDRNIRGFQAGRRLVQSSTIGASTWAALFGRVTTRPNVALMQYQTGAAQWSNCGPAAAVSLLLNRRITPAGWDGNAANRAVAVANFRYSAMGVANTSARNPHGTEFPDFQPAFAKYGLSAWHGGISDTITEARAGRPSIAGGDAYRMPYGKFTRGPASHWVAVLGWNGASFLVVDPLSRPEVDIVHEMTESQLRYYAATNPGHPASTASRNSILVR